MPAQKSNISKKTVTLKIKALESKITPDCMTEEECIGLERGYSKGAGGPEGYVWCYNGRLAVVADY